MTTGTPHVVFAFAALLIANGCASEDRDTGKISSASGQAPTVRYAYDPLGRLVQAAAADGTAAQYSYDAVGNLTAVRRLSGGTLRVVDFSPPAGLIGSTVAVFGAGFGATPSDNAVTFNGTAATVVAATPNALTVTVPAGATTGKIAVGSGGSSATSTVDYAVLTSSGAPGISGFSPAFGSQGTVVSVTGINFKTRVVDDKVLVGDQLAEIVQDGSSPTGTLVKFTVPSSSATGKIEVTTPLGSAVSSDEFFAVPPGVNPGDIEAVGRVSVNGAARALTTTTAGKKLLWVFDAAAGQQLHLVTTAGSFAGGFTVDVYDPAGTKIQTLSMINNNVGDLLSPTATAGPYTVVVNPSATDKGSVQLGVVSDVTGAVAVGGSTAVTLVSGQNARLSFTAQAGTGYGLAVTGLSFTPGTGSPSMGATLRKADGSALATCLFFGSNSCDFDPVSFAAAGTYLIDFDPAGLVAASFTAVLSSDVTGTLAVDAQAATTVTTVRPGQNARYSFTGTAGQAMTVVLSGNAFDDGNPGTTNSTQILVFTPSGSALNVVSINTVTSGTTLDVVLPQTATYTLAIKPSALDLGSINVQLTSYATGPLTLDGSTPISLAGGQNGRFSFTAQAGTGYGLAITGLTFTPSTGSPTLSAILHKPDGPTLVTCGFTGNTSCDFDPATFATAGTYVIDFDPPGVIAASFTAILSTDASGTVAIDGAPATVTIARAGQNARYTFAGTAGQAVSVVVNGSTIDDGNTSTLVNNQVLVVRPNGSVLASNAFNAVAGGVALDVALPDTGTYTVAIKPTGLDAGTANLAVRSVATGTLAVDGSTALNLASGQNGRFSFTAQANTGYGLALANLVLTPSTAVPTPGVGVTLRKADGTSLTTCTFTAGGSCDLAPTMFATTGTYLVDVDPNGTIAASGNAVLSTDVAGTITVDAPPVAVTIARAGQNARYSFAGTAGQAVAIAVTGNTLDDGNAGTVNNTQLAVFKPSSPNANAIGSANFNTNASGTTVNLTLPETGTYTITINPSGLDSGSFNLGVTHP